jgi:hypothetical protein
MEYLIVQVEAYWDAILEREANNWCDDLCVSISKMTDRKMMAIDLNSNHSYTCGAGQRPCTSTEKAEFTQMMENEEKTEAAYCAQVCACAHYVAIFFITSL